MAHHRWECPSGRNEHEHQEKKGGVMKRPILIAGGFVAGFLVGVVAIVYHACSVANGGSGRTPIELGKPSQEEDAICL